MRVIVQRVTRASVRVGGEVVGQCGNGLLVLVAASKSSTSEQAKQLADRVAGLRIFNDAEGKMNLSLKDLPESRLAQVLVISQFTLYGDVYASRRPSFIESANYEDGKRLYTEFCDALRSLVRGLETGVFGASMEVELVNDGPVTIQFDAKPIR
ncbi:D-aminoacyl-tRNA deacylase [Kamptonema cortianum]|nr:D-aminoacyl-tRNA deacylase [Geitlerinema splendidum]MDK3158557.1 D-aminoacyl-tRNA deacylase [Kamptonema cortianum]